MSGAPIEDRISQCWNFQQLEQSEADLRSLRRELEQQGATTDVLQVDTQIARTSGLRGRFDEAHALLDDVEPHVDAAPPVVGVRYWLERGRVLNSSDRAAEARPLFERAFDVASGAGLEALAVDAAHMVAITWGSDTQALVWNEKALALATGSSDERAQRWVPALSNNLGWTMVERGELGRALLLLEESLEAHRKWGSPRTVRMARYAVAHVLRRTGRIDEASSILRELEAEWADAGQASGYVFEELAECLWIQGEHQEATTYFRKAHDELSRDDWLRKHEPDRLARLEQMARGDTPSP